MSNDPRAALPAVDRLLGHPTLTAEDAPPRWAVVSGCRTILSGLRKEVSAGSPAPDLDAVALRVLQESRRLARPEVRRVINATGVVLHTNLGRAPMSPAVARAVAEAAASYTNLELDLGTGRRGHRSQGVERLLRLLTGAEATLVVNNNAAAVYLALRVLAGGRGVIVSRGELVEIGGSFRMPDVMTAAGCHLVEVGTTNRTHLRDYADAIGPETGMIAKIHRSNFTITGFTKEVRTKELAQLAASSGVPLMEDVGSGLFGAPPPGSKELQISRVLADGADLVTFSGDKLLGGPQAGVLAGRADLIAQLASDPMMRALRPCKLILTAMEGCLLEHLANGGSQTSTLWKLDTEALRCKAEELLERLRNKAPAVLRTLSPEIVETEQPVGGGSIPGLALRGAGIALDSPLSPHATLSALREAVVPIVGRILDDRVVLDMRCILEGDEAELVAGLGQLADRVGPQLPDA